MVSALSPEAALYSMKKNTKNKERETDGDDELKRQLHFGTSSPPRRLGRARRGEAESERGSDGGVCNNSEASIGSVDQSDVTIDSVVSFRLILRTGFKASFSETRTQLICVGVGASERVDSQHTHSHSH